MIKMPLALMGREKLNVNNRYVDKNLEGYLDIVIET